MTTYHKNKKNLESKIEIQKRNKSFADAANQLNSFNILRKNVATLEEPSNSAFGKKETIG